MNVSTVPPNVWDDVWAEFHNGSRKRYSTVPPDVWDDVWAEFHNWLSSRMTTCPLEAYILRQIGGVNNKDIPHKFWVEFHKGNLKHYSTLTGFPIFIDQKRAKFKKDDYTKFRNLQKLCAGRAWHSRHRARYIARHAKRRMQRQEEHKKILEQCPTENDLIVMMALNRDDRTISAEVRRKDPRVQIHHACHRRIGDMKRVEGRLELRIDILSDNPSRRNTQEKRIKEALETGDVRKARCNYTVWGTCIDAARALHFLMKDRNIMLKDVTKDKPITIFTINKRHPSITKWVSAEHNSSTNRGEVLEKHRGYVKIWENVLVDPACKVKGLAISEHWYNQEKQKWEIMVLYNTLKYNA